MRTGRRRLGNDGENHERWLLTYADLITLLLAFFIVMYSMSQIDNKKFGKVSDALMIIEEIFGGLDTPGSGIVFTVPIENVRGLAPEFE